jgi:hypothetical protein
MSLAILDFWSFHHFFLSGFQFRVAFMIERLLPTWITLFPDRNGHTGKKSESPG